MPERLMDTTDLTDVIARAQAKDASAFDELLERYGRRLYGYFYRALGRRADAEDLLQETFVRLVGTIAQYRHEGRFEPWLFRIATNLVRDRIRRSRASREISPRLAGPDDGRSLGQMLETHGESREDGRSPMDRLASAEELDQLGRAIHALPEPERMVILLRHFSELPFREIAEIMGTPLGTALARAHRGLARLRELMTFHADGPGPVGEVE